MGRKVSGFMIKGELPGSACEILHMLGVPPSVTYEGKELNEFYSEGENAQIEGQATPCEYIDPNKFDLEKINDDRRFAEVEVRKFDGWTFAMARWAFVGIPSDYIESYNSAVDSYSELYEQMEDRLGLYGDYEFLMKEVGQRIIEFDFIRLLQLGCSAYSIYERQRDIMLKNLINFERRLQTTEKNNNRLHTIWSYPDTPNPYLDNNNYSDEQLEVRRGFGVGRTLLPSDSNPLLRNYDALKILSRGGEAIHFYKESYCDTKGFARFVDGKAVDPIWHLGGNMEDSIFNYETGQWVILPEFISDDVDFDEVVESELIPKYTSIESTDFHKAPIYYCYIGESRSRCPHG